MLYSDRAGLRISNVGVGCYSLSGVYGKKDRDEFERMIRRAYDLGVTFFDTAPTYGDAEEFLGNVVTEFRDDVCIATKVGLSEEKGVGFDLSPSTIKASCEMSLRRLNTHYIDVYQVHFSDGKTPVEEVVGTLESLKDAGKIRAWGVCHLPAKQIAEYCSTGKAFSIMMELSAVARSNREALLPICQRKGVAGIAFSTTGRGILTGSIKQGHVFAENDLRSYDPLFQREQFESAMKVVNEISNIATKYGKTRAQVAISWVLCQPAVVCALTGPSTVDHLEENIGATGWRIPQEDMEELERVFKGEDEWLNRRRRESICAILERPIKPETRQAFTDLLYVLEVSTLSGLLEESVAVPIMQRLLKLRDGACEDAARRMDNIRQELKIILLSVYSG